MSFYAELKQRNVIRVAIAYLAGSWLLIQVLETLFPIFGLPETSIRIVVVILGILFVPAVILSWVFEITPDGIQLNADAVQTTERTPADRKTFDRVIIVTLVVALGYFAIDKFVLDPARDAAEVQAAAERAAAEALVGAFGDHSIVVLPFLNMSSDPDQEYFSDGTAEEILNLLANIEGLRVISRSSAFAFKGRDIGISEIAQRLKVAHVLEGSVRKAGNEIRVTAQLIDARTDTHLWSGTYDHELDDVFAIQDEIAAQVVEQLKIEIFGEMPHAEQISTAAYNLYLRGAHIGHSGQWDKLPLAEKLLTEALELEPHYLPALTELGRVYLNSSPDDNRSAHDLRQLVRDLSDRVTVVAPGSVTDLSWRAWIAFAFDNDLATAASLYERALALEPGNIDTLRGVTRLLIELGYIEEAIATAKYVVVRDPLCVLCLHGLSWAHRAAGEYDAAVEILREAVDWSPDRHLIYWSLGSTLLQAGKPAEALAAFEKEQDVAMQKLGRVMALHDLGRTQEFEQEFASIRSEDSSTLEGIARIAAWTSKNDLALEYLEKMVEEDGPKRLTGITSGGFYERLRRDPRFDAMLHKYGQHPDEQEKIPFKLTLPE